MNIPAVSSVISNTRNTVAPRAAAANDREQKTEEGKTQKPDTATNPQQLELQERKKLTELKTRDAEVRAHERAHLSAAGRYATGGANFTFQRGPDGRNYAVGGEVSIDSSPVPNDPHATLEKALTIHKAALAPVQPSTQDRSVAAKAIQMAAQARAEIQSESRSGENENNNRGSKTGAYESVAAYNEDLPTKILFGVA